MNRQTTLSEPDSAAYARLGRFTAALLGSLPEWNGGDELQDIATEASRAFGTQRAIGDQNPDQLKLWRNVADEIGLGLDFSDDECRECGDSLDDGEGSDGWCGNCADRHSCTRCLDAYEDLDDLTEIAADGGTERVCAECAAEIRQEAAR